MPAANGRYHDGLQQQWGALAHRVITRSV